MLDLKRGRISYDDRVHGLWQADGNDMPGSHLDNRDFPFEVRLGNDPWLDFGHLRGGRTRPKTETQKPYSAQHVHSPPLCPVAMLSASSLPAVARCKTRFN